MRPSPIRSLPNSKESFNHDQLPSIPLLGQTEILAVRDGGLVDCLVPAELIDYEEVPVKEEWAEALAGQMQEKAARMGGTGQETPIQAGYIDGEGLFKIKDGFHRDAALRLLGVDNIYTTVSHTTWNDLYDDRIFTAKDHAHVRFSRVVQWIREVWEHSGLSDQMTVEQAVLLYRFGTNGSKLGIDPLNVNAAKVWVQRKERQWGMAAMTFHGYLAVAANVNPTLVHSTREKRSGHVLEAPTQNILKVLSDTIPGEDNFGLQDLVVTTAISRNLKGPEVKALSLSVAGKDLNSAQEFIEDIDWNNWQPVFSDSKDRQLRRAYDPRQKGAAVLNGVATDLDKIIQRVGQSLERGEEVTPDMEQHIEAALRRTQELYGQLGALTTQLWQLHSGEEVDEALRWQIATMAAATVWQAKNQTTSEIQPHEVAATNVERVDDKPLSEAVEVKEDLVDQATDIVAKEIGLDVADLGDVPLEDDDEDGLQLPPEAGRNPLGELDAMISARYTKNTAAGPKDKRFPIDFRFNGKKFSRDHMKASAFAKFEETLRILIAVGFTNKPEHTFLDGAQKRTEFMLRITNKSCEEGTKLTEDQLHSKLEEYAEAGLLQRTEKGFELTETGFTKVMEDSPSIGGNGKVITPKKK
jgi:hypothetical protein